ncbi:hypothetical protein F4808DRAFT_410696 [Astrocystis sublimbata]|nr:hypothetical protein F4808DRAFT_410696 [Astrocystis sublimbata]
MPPRLPAQLRPYGLSGAVSRAYPRPNRQSTCLYCSVSPYLGRTKVARHPKKSPPLSDARRSQSTVAPQLAGTNAAKLDPRSELESILLDLQKHAADYVNLSRLQLALNGLRQRPGNEAIRVAILGLYATDGSAPTHTAKEVLKLLLSDPLKDAEPWEQEVEEHNLAEPVVIRVGAQDSRGPEPAISLKKRDFLREIHVSSATLNGHSLEILVAETNPLPPAADRAALDDFEDTVLVPTVDIPTSNTGQYTPITTPVHKALVIADGIRGAASVLSMPTLTNSSVLQYAVDIPEYKPTNPAALPFTAIDTATARVGLDLVRKDVRNGIEFEQLWFKSNIPKLVDWLKADVLTAPDNATKLPVRNLIASLLRNTSVAIEAEEARIATLSAYLADAGVRHKASQKTIESGLADWAESAHSELQEQLEIAFSGRRWRKLSWWKLFWRADDVVMLTNDILAQRFLPEAERSSIFLAGRMREAGLNLSETLIVPYPNLGTSAVSTQLSDVPPGKPDVLKALRREIVWPENIPSARDHLQTVTVPHLQALAQKLVVQTLSTSGMTTALAALVYVGTLSTSLYEAGAVAALGIVWSSRRMQKMWEGVRAQWEGQVREQGRLAIRGVEETMVSAMNESTQKKIGKDATEAQNGLTRAKDLVARAERVLEELK